MNQLLAKLNFRDQERIAVINAEEEIISKILDDAKITIDRNIDPRYPYGFMIFFVKNSREVEQYAPMALHNLVADGVRWFCYPKKTSRKYRADIDRDHGWNTLNDSGLRIVRQVTIDENWSAIRFRNIKYVKSSSDRQPD
jgi:hypothetical protein